MTEKKRPEIKEIKKLTDSRFLNMYELDAVDRKGGPVDYFVASRARDIKDMKLSVEQSETIGLTLPVLTQVLSECRSLEEAGLGDLGTQGLIRYYEK